MEQKRSELAERYGKLDTKRGQYGTRTKTLGKFQGTLGEQVANTAGSVLNSLQQLVD